MSGDEKVDEGDALTVGTDKIPVSGVVFDAMVAEPSAMGDRLLLGLSDNTYENIKTYSGVRTGRISWHEILK